jgi:hypothetical protein
MLGRLLRRQKTAVADRDIRPMHQEEAIQFMTGVIRPRAAFAAEQFCLEHADTKPGDDGLAMAVIAMRATVEDFTLESCDMARLRDQDRAKVIARLQAVGVDAFLERFGELYRQKAALG